MGDEVGRGIPLKTWPLHGMAKVFIVDMREREQPEAAGGAQQKEQTERGQQIGRD